MQQVFRSQKVGEGEVFYREAGPTNGPVILLLHGFPTAGHMFRDTGHFALETHAAEIGALMRDFLARHLG